MKSLTLLFVGVVLVWSYAFAQSGSSTVIFTDSQFVSENNKIAESFLNNCFNPKTFATSAVEMFSVPGTNPGHLMGHETTQVDSATAAKAEQVLNYFRHIGDNDHLFRLTKRTQQMHDLHPFFNRRLSKESQVGRFMIFMGHDDLQGSPLKYRELAKKITANGKACYINLPSLTADEEKNQEIVQHNNRVLMALVGTQCRLVDVSETLTKGTKGKTFEYDEKGRLQDSEADKFSQATCQALKTAAKRMTEFAGPSFKLLLPPAPAKKEQEKPTALEKEAEFQGPPAPPQEMNFADEPADDGATVLFAEPVEQ